MATTTGIRRDTVTTPQGEMQGDPRFVGHTAALKDLQDFVQTRQIPYLGQWYSRIALQYLGIEVTLNERVSDWADEGRYLIREVHTHGDHVMGFGSQEDGHQGDWGGEEEDHWGPSAAAPAASAHIRASAQAGSVDSER